MSSEVKNAAPLMFLKPRRDDKQLIGEAVNHFDGLQIGASDAVAAVELVKNIGKPFIVDPMAYMFVLPPGAVLDVKTGKVRPSLSNLAHRYGSLTEAAIGKRAISAEDVMRDGPELEEIVRNCLEYQRSKITGQLNLFAVPAYYDKYSLLDDDGGEKHHEANSVSPWVLIAPFFYFKATTDPWYAVTLRCAKLAGKYAAQGETLYVSLLMSPDLLDSPEQLRKIVADLNGLRVGGVFLWINGMDEETASSSRLFNLLALVSGLKRSGRPVFKMHGGYFSALMNPYGLAGFSCTLSYRTSRNILSYKWRAPRPPSAKFYIAPLHRAYDLDEAAHILKVFPFARCACAVCRDVYGTDLDKMTARMAQRGLCHKHFLNVRKQELLSVRTGHADSMKVLDNSISRFGRHNAREVAHLAKWRKVFADFDAALPAGPVL